MNNPEISNQFDILYNNITSDKAPGLNEYEKSVFLTKAQDEIVKNYFNPKSNAKQEGFDDSPKRQHDFSTLIKTVELEPLVSNISDGTLGAGIFDPRGIDFKYTEDMFLILNEQLYNKDTKFVYTIKPLSYVEYDRVMQRPYKFPPKNQIWRLMIDTQTDSGTKEVTVIEPTTVYYAGEKTFSIANNTSEDLGYQVPNNSPWKSAKMYIKMKDSNTWTIRIGVVETESIGAVTTREQYYEVCSPTIDTEQKIITIWIPDNLTLQNVYSFIVTDVNLWNYIDTLVFPDETQEMKDELYNYSGIVTSIYQDSILPEQKIEYEEVQKIVTVSSSKKTAELIGRWYGNVNKIVYKVRYVKRPKPIILVNLSDIAEGLSFEYAGEEITTETECELPESLHSEILQRAVELAKAAWAEDQEQIAGVNMHTTMGQRSE